MSYLLPHLDSGWAVDQAILTEEAKVVVIRFGRDSDPVCMQMDETLADISDGEGFYNSKNLVDWQLLVYGL